MTNIDKKTKCICQEDVYDNTGRWMKNVYVHLTWCPESFEAKRYQALSWYKKLFTVNPVNL